MLKGIDYLLYNTIQFESLDLLTPMGVGCVEETSVLYRKKSS